MYVHEQLEFHSRHLLTGLRNQASSVSSLQDEFDELVPRDPETIVARCFCAVPLSTPFLIQPHSNIE